MIQTLEYFKNAPPGEFILELMIAAFVIRVLIEILRDN